SHPHHHLPPGAHHQSGRRDHHDRGRQGGPARSQGRDLPPHSGQDLGRMHLSQRGGRQGKWITSIGSSCGRSPTWKRPPRARITSGGMVSWTPGPPPPTLTSPPRPTENPASTSAS